MLNLPYAPLPAASVCATKVVALSTSVALSVPLVVRIASVSLRLWAVSPLMTAASLVPVIFTVITWLVPSAVATVRVSV